MPRGCVNLFERWLVFRFQNFFEVGNKLFNIWDLSSFIFVCACLWIDVIIETRPVLAEKATGIIFTALDFDRIIDSGLCCGLRVEIGTKKKIIYVFQQTCVAL